MQSAVSTETARQHANQNEVDKSIPACKDEAAAANDLINRAAEEVLEQAACAYAVHPEPKVLRLDLQDCFQQQESDWRVPVSLTNAEPWTSSNSADEPVDLPLVVTPRSSEETQTKQQEVCTNPLFYFAVGAFCR